MLFLKQSSQRFYIHGTSCLFILFLNLYIQFFAIDRHGFRSFHTQFDRSPLISNTVISISFPIIMDSFTFLANASIILSPLHVLLQNKVFHLIICIFSNDLHALTRSRINDQWRLFVYRCAFHICRYRCQQKYNQIIFLDLANRL